MLAVIGALVLSWTSISIPVTPPEFSAAKEPQVAIGTNARIYIAYGIGDATYLSISESMGLSYQPPIKVAESGKLALGMRRGPRISVNGSTITISAVYGSKGGGQDGDLLAFKSTDLGKTWSTGAKVNDVAGSAREGLHAMAVATDGTLACAWLDLRTTGTKLYASFSKDGGLTWAPNKLVYASPSGSICECCHPSLAFDEQGRLHVMFRNSLSGERDMYVTTIERDGTINPAKKLGQGTWMLNACPMDGGMLIPMVGGLSKTVWRREGKIYQADVDGKEILLGEGKQPWIAGTSDNPWIVWQSGQNILAKFGTSAAEVISKNGNDPAVASTNRASIAAWTESGIKATLLIRP